MMILPVVGGGSVTLTGDIVSMPYIHMTAAVMRDMGANVDIKATASPWATDIHGQRLYRRGRLERRRSMVCPRGPAAWLIAHPPGTHANSIQGDAGLVELGNRLGIATRFDAQGATLDTSHFIGCCCSCFADMGSTPDLAPSWAVLLCLLERSFRMTGLRTLRHKESDRIEALRTELLKLGYVLKIESEDAISWYGERVETGPQPPVIDPHGDHRLAMAFAPAAVRFPGLIITDADVVGKSYPAYWRHLQASGLHHQSNMAQ